MSKRKPPTEADKARGLRIRTRRKELGITHNHIAKELKLTDSAISQWESGYTAPSIDQVSKLAKILKTSEAYILTGEPAVRQPDDRNVPDVSSILDAPLTVPVYGTVRGGSDGDFLLQSETIVEHVRRPAGLAQLKEVYALNIVGDSMAPWGVEGDLIYVAPTRPPSPGCHVVVQLEDEKTGQVQSATVKKYLGRDATKIRLAQYNPAKEFSMPLSRVKAIHRVLTMREVAGA